VSAISKVVESDSAVIRFEEELKRILGLSRSLRAHSAGDLDEVATKQTVANMIGVIAQFSDATARLISTTTSYTVWRTCAFALQPEARRIPVPNRFVRKSVRNKDEPLTLSNEEARIIRNVDKLLG